jgi:hypothetical protein
MSEETSDLVVADQAYNPFDMLPEALRDKIKATSEQLASCAVSVNRIAHRPTSWSLPNGDQTDVLVGHIIAVKHANLHYQGQYERGKVNPLDCFAVVENGDAPCKDLVPHSLVESPYATKCGDCPKFQWGSFGKGKECGEHTILAVNIPVLGDGIYVIDMKKGNSRVADNYVAAMRDKFGHPLAATTKFTIGEKREWEAELTAVGTTSQELVTNLAGRIDEAEAILLERVKGGYNPPGEAAAASTADAPPVRRGKAAA